MPTHYAPRCTSCGTWWGRTSKEKDPAGWNWAGRAGTRPDPHSDYILTLSTVIVSSSTVPSMVTLWPAWATTLSWLAILYTLPSLTRTAGEPPLMQRTAQAAWSAPATLSGVLPAHDASAM